MQLDPVSFQQGVQSAFLKQGSESMFTGVAGSFFPYSSAQKTWSAKLTGTKLRLSDGTKNYDFSLGSKPEGGTTVPVEKHEDDTHTFDSEVTDYKTQVHKSSPVAIHFTIHNGKSNPTFNLRHETGKVWQLESKTKNKEKQASGFTDIAETTGSVGGGIGGSVIGGALGTLIPIPVVGSLLGSIGGGYLGSSIGRAATGIPAKLIEGGAQAGTRLAGKAAHGAKNLALQQFNPAHNPSVVRGNFNFGSPYFQQ